MLPIVAQPHGEIPQTASTGHWAVDQMIGFSRIADLSLFTESRFTESPVFGGEGGSTSSAGTTEKMASN